MRVGIVQLTSTENLQTNLDAADKALQEAVDRGAGFVALPENFAYMRREGDALHDVRAIQSAAERCLSDWARRHHIWLLGGSFPEAIENDERVYNTSVLLSPEGIEVARYRKIHLFDVSLGANAEEVYCESRHFKPGREIVTAATPFGHVGLSICYDLRFPELYRGLVERNAGWITVPSAFVRETGKDHWRVLLRARAIESQAFVLAPAQCGRHSADRTSHGHSLLIDPWGSVLAEAANEPCVLIANCPEAEIDRVRKAIPALSHRRLPSGTQV
ncbi:MAG: carbon-nitrogen hydrolase family protein [Myxococcota bacterium]